MHNFMRRCLIRRAVHLRGPTSGPRTHASGLPIQFRGNYHGDLRHGENATCKLMSVETKLLLSDRRWSCALAMGMSVTIAHYFPKFLRNFWTLNAYDVYTNELTEVNLDGFDSDVSVFQDLIREELLYSETQCALADAEACFAKLQCRAEEILTEIIRAIRLPKPEGIVPSTLKLSIGFYITPEQTINWMSRRTGIYSPKCNFTTWEVDDTPISQDVIENAIDIYCWDVAEGSEIFVGVTADENAEFLLSDACYGTLDENFGLDTGEENVDLCNFFFPILPTVAVYILGTITRSSHLRPAQIVLDRESEIDVHLRNAMILSAATTYEPIFTKVILFFPLLHHALDLVGMWWIEWRRRTRAVAVKFFRRVMVQNVKEKLYKRLQAEVLTWHHLCHRNVSQLYGIVQTEMSVGMVSAWCEHGTIKHYLKSVNPKANRMKLPIHDFKPPIVHGDLKGGNILIDYQGYAIITDFGLSKVMSDFSTSDGILCSSFFAGTMRWMAPEMILALVDDESEAKVPRVTTASDVYAFGSVCLEIMTGALPYPCRKHDPGVMIDIMRGIKPSRGAPTPDSEAFSMLLDACWRQEAALRPKMGEVLKCLIRMDDHAGNEKIVRFAYVIVSL
ncbi:kinase-like domain-containing protein [Desarmillaria tabescens]|uniref:Kinase-like domain-containing protein n=1 Tax=Armillaria tabescens TaxID=1929756 RepID=A0AA39MHI8_ARMTA|nr:kinase-like domain-containing protein [Desarmillaria tabescens]KAK0434552.1 kinase-like domain-containing protein [Desarmillaria tabescens]